MKKSEKILSQSDIPHDITESERMTIENNVLLKHIIDNDIKHLWAWVKGVVMAIVALVFTLIFKR